MLRLRGIKKICLHSGQAHKVQDRVWGTCAVLRVTDKCMAHAQYLGRVTGKFLARRLAMTKAQMERSTVKEVFYF